MLRITVRDNTLQLEGCLEGPCLGELMRCWQDALAGQQPSKFRVDLTGVTYIGASGKACLEAMHRQGAEFIAADCATKAVVAEITQSPFPSLNCTANRRV